MLNGTNILPMSGLKVLDLSWHLAVPYGTRLLADYGAEVIKIERPVFVEPPIIGQFIELGPLWSGSSEG